MSESPTEHFEHAEHAEHIAHSGDPFLAKVSVTIAVLAVLSAAVGSLETLETAATIRDKTAAAIIQNKATDTWDLFARQSIKKTLYDLAGDNSSGARTDGYRSKANSFEADSRRTEQNAQELEKQVELSNAASERHEHRHQVLTIAATFLHISIAVATIAIVMRGRRWPYVTAVALGLLGAIGTVAAYLS